jgi:peptide/nickel transport system permease protein
MSATATQTTSLNQSFWATVGRQFRKKKVAVISFYIAFFLAVVAVLAPFLANEKPIVCQALFIFRYLSKLGSILV